MKRSKLLPVLLIAPFCALAQNVTLTSKDRPAAQVFREIMLQTDKNFVYSTETFKDLRLSVDVKNKPLDKVLKEIFKDTGVTYKIKGRNVVLKLEKKPNKIRKVGVQKTAVPKVAIPDSVKVRMLNELTVVSRLENPVVETAEIGARKVTAEEIRNIPALLGETDVIKALQSFPGVSEGTEGMAGMIVHGGGADENLYMLDNVPLYQVNHFGGFFSAFNNDIVRYIDFYKSSIPAKFEGRLSSFMDVRLKEGNRTGHHGTARLGLTSGAFNIAGPIGGRTTYLFGIRRSWYDVLTVPALAVLNRKRDEKIDFRYSFMDINGKITHRFNDKAKGFICLYYGDDELHTGSHDDFFDAYGWKDSMKTSFDWGNILAQVGLNYRFSDNLEGEFSGSFTRYFSKLNHEDKYEETGDVSLVSMERTKMRNSINDWVLRGDMLWRPNEDMKLRFGASFTFHSFLPTRTSREYQFNDSFMATRDSVWSLNGTEGKVYLEDEWRISDKVRLNIGANASFFHLDNKTHTDFSPRVSLAYQITPDIAVKGAYAHTIQYVHQLSQSYLSLPTDQWIPITGRFKPQRADKGSLGIYWQSPDRFTTISLEGYYKKMSNLLDYSDEYYLQPPLSLWDAQLTTGTGTAKGVDICIEKDFGKLSARLSYSLAWSERKFAEKNGGLKFPSRFDNRHTINLALNWKINSKVELNAFWTGHSGNRFTLLTQDWIVPPFDKYVSGFWSSEGYYGGSGGVRLPANIYDDEHFYIESVPLKGKVNNYQLPFYHRLDLSCVVRNKRGYWTFGLYNAYCHMNTVAIVRKTDWVLMDNGYYSSDTKPVFKKFKLFPVIPSISYTWEF